MGDEIMCDKVAHAVNGVGGSNTRPADSGKRVRFKTGEKEQKNGDDGHHYGVQVVQLQQTRNEARTFLARLLFTTRRGPASLLLCSKHSFLSRHFHRLLTNIVPFSRHYHHL